MYQNATTTQSEAGAKMTKVITAVEEDTNSG
jgi:hypothetical protein